MRKSKLILIIITAFMFIFLCACGDNAEKPDTRTFESGILTITFDYEKISGYATNQFAVWVEDMGGNYINTLYVTKWTADGGYKNRPDAIALWIEKSDLASMQKLIIDAVAGATPKSGDLAYTWDLTDAKGSTVSPGEYKFFVEGTLRWKNYVLYSGVITIGDTPVTVTADAEYNYETSGNQAALSSESPENAMIGTVTASFMPAVND